MKQLLLVWFPFVLGAAELRIEGTILAKDKPVAPVNARVSFGGRSVVADAQGRYRVDGFAAGARVHAVASAPGFASVERDIEVAGNGVMVVDWALPLLNRSESVVVEGGLLSVRSNAPEHGQTVTRAQLEDLPSNGRRLMRFALLDPHVRPAIGLGADGNDSYRLSINASSYRHTAYLIDGTINYDWYLAVAPQQPVSVGAVEEVKVLSGQYAAEFGTTTAGLVSVATKSGTDQFHGEAIGFLRPNGIQAQAPLAAASLAHIPNRREQWGGSLGGPIRRSKTYVFGNYEGSHQERGAYIQSPVPGFFTGNIDEHYALAKVDHWFSDNNWLSWRANGHAFQGDNVNDFVSGFNQPSFGRVAKLQSHGSQLSWHAVAGRAFNELKASYASYVPNSAFPLSPSVGVSRPSYAVEGNSSHSWAHVRNLSVGDVVAVGAGKHQVKAGVSYLRQTLKDFAYTPLGTYTYAAGPPTAGQNPLRFAQTFGMANLRYGQTVASGFVQDDMRLHPRVSLNLGLRYENQSITQDRNNFAPRAGLAWDLRGDGKTVVRAGAGMFYDQYYLYIYRRFYSLAIDAPTASYTVPFGDPAFPVFPNSLAAPPAGISSGRRDIMIKPDRMLNPYSLQYTLAVERALWNGFTLKVDGLHSHVLKQIRVNDINHPAPFLRTAPGQVRTAAQADVSRPFTTWSGVPVRLIALIENSASSIYDSVTVSVRKQTRRYFVDAHYAASSSATYTMFHGDANGGVPNEWDNFGSAERGPSDFHQRHRFVANGTTFLPWGLQLSMSAFVSSGLPVNPLTGTDNNGDTYSADRPVGFGRNSFRGPKQIQFDTGLRKSIRVTEKVRFDVRAEAFNVFNRSNYINVNNVYGDTGVARATFLSPIAGVVNTDPSRQLQLALKVWF